MPAAAAPAQSNSQQLSPGSRFSIPPFTDEVEQPDNNDGLVANFSASSQVQVQGLIPFQQSDVIYEWLLFVSVVETITGTTSITQSPLYPEIYLGPFQLNMQYQYPAIDVASGLDLSLITEMRPFVSNSNAYPLQRGAHALSSLYSSQVDQVTSQTAYPDAVTAVQDTRNFLIEIPACVYFDEYYELDETGNAISGPHTGYVSPQNMGGYARVVTPSVKLNALINAGPDQSPYTAVGAPAAVGVATLGFSRIGVLGNVDSSVLPQPTNWQYNITHLRWGLGGVSKTSIPLNSAFAGQIMAIAVRLYDPVANAPIVLETALSTATNAIQLLYGGSVNRWVGNEQRMQWRFFGQHGYLPRQGVIILDLATDRNGHITNSYVLNTLRTAAVNLNLLFTGALSVSAYAEITIEGLRYVPLPVRPNQ
ncbi:MAG: hypothetical protein ACRETA_04465 [Gammaproteobacteria bacterium]